MNWQPIETAPKSSRLIACRNPLPGRDYPLWLVRRVEGKKHTEFYAGTQRVFPTHWIQEPPK